MENNFDLVKKILSLPWYNLILISILMIPVFIGAWVSLLNTLSITLSESQKKVVVLSFIALYSIGLIVGKIGHDKEEKDKNDLIVQTLKLDLKEAGGLLGFQRIRFKHPSYDDKTLYFIADKYSSTFSIEPIADINNMAVRDKDDPIGLKLR
jgi:hypothetical protein